MKKHLRNRGIIALILVMVLLAAPVESLGKSEDGVAELTNPAVTDCVPGQVIVSFVNDLSQKREESVIRKAVEETAAEISADEVQLAAIDEEYTLVAVDQEADTSKLMKTLQEDPAVESVQPNYYYTANGTLDDAQVQDAWYMDYIDLPEAWSVIEQYQKNGTIKDPARRVKIATIDSGMNLSHEDVADIQDGGNFDFEHCKTILEGKDPEEQVYPNPLFYHGSATSSVIGATSNNEKGIAGIAAGYHNDIASVMAINVFQKTIGSIHKATTADICAGIDYACNHGAQVIMMCLGHGPSSLDGRGNVIDDAALESKINWATYEMDAVCLASAGNNADTEPWYPSDIDACVSVISSRKYTDIDSVNCKAQNSSYGSKKDISAPGAGINSCGGENTAYYAGYGTSLAVAVAAGVTGLVRYVNPGLTQDKVKKLLYSTATDLYKAGYDIYTGYGNINAYAAVTAAAGKAAKISPRKLKTVKVSAASAGKRSIALTWNDVGADRYEIYRTKKPAAGYKLIKTVTGTSWINRGLKFNQRYYYKAKPKGTSDDGKRIDGARSVRASAKPTCGSTTIRVKKWDRTQDRISWTKATSASGYRIYRANYKKGKYTCVRTIQKASQRACLVKRPKAKKKYYYKIRAYIRKNNKIYLGPPTKAKTY